MNLTQRHINCKDVHCEICFEDNVALIEAIEKATNNDLVDQGGYYHKFLSDNGIEPETEHGWWSKEAFELGNIASYVTFFKLKEKKGE